MFSHIKGNIEKKFINYIIIDVNGIGFKINMSKTAIDSLPEAGEEVREDDISLFGFMSLEELRMFELLIGVSGIGAKSALTMLSNIEPSSFAIAVISDDVVKLTKIPSIGKKTAQRIILELKDKLKEESIETKINAEEIKNEIESNSKLEEAISALKVLGYTKTQIDEALMNVNINNSSIEDIIKIALKNLA